MKEGCCGRSGNRIDRIYETEFYSPRFRKEDCVEKIIFTMLLLLGRVMEDAEKENPSCGVGR